MSACRSCGTEVIVSAAAAARARVFRRALEAKGEQGLTPREATMCIDCYRRHRRSLRGTA